MSKNKGENAVNEKVTLNKRRERRTKKQIENSILGAIESLVAEQGFKDIPVTKLLREAGIDPNIFYRRYNSIYEIYDVLAKKYDFWVNEKIEISKLKTLGDKRFFVSVMQTLFKDLRNNSVMQKLLLWELNDVNETTKRTSGLRDTMNANLLFYYNQLFQNAGIDVHGIMALLIAGTYYLTLHRGLATFCMIDFNTKEGERVFNSTIEVLAELLFSHIEYKKNQQRMIRQMVADKIPHKNICKYFEMTSSELKQILKLIDIN